MKTGLADKVLDKIYKQSERLSSKIEKQFKGVKPFNAEPIDPGVLAWSLDNLTTVDMDALFQEYGEEGVMLIQQKRQELANRRGR